MSVDKRILMIGKTSQTYHLDIEDITVQPVVLLQYSVSQQKYLHQAISAISTKLFLIII